jgi:hypothetical protein
MLHGKKTKTLQIAVEKNILIIDTYYSANKSFHFI